MNDEQPKEVGGPWEPNLKTAREAQALNLYVDAGADVSLFAAEGARAAMAEIEREVDGKVDVGEFRTRCLGLAHAKAKLEALRRAGANDVWLYDVESQVGAAKGKLDMLVNELTFDRKEINELLIWFVRLAQMTVGPRWPEVSFGDLPLKTT